MISFHTAPCKNCGKIATFSSIEPWVCRTCLDEYVGTGGNMELTEEADRELNPDDFCYNCQARLGDEDYSSKHVGQCKACFDEGRKLKGLG